MEEITRQLTLLRVDILSHVTTFDKPQNGVTTMNHVDLHVENLSQENTIHISTENNFWNVTVFREENGEVSVVVCDNLNEGQLDLVLGQDGFTQTT